MKRIIFLIMLISVGTMFFYICNAKEEKKIDKQIKIDTEVKINSDGLYVNVVKKMDQEDTNKIINVDDYESNFKENIDVNLVSNNLEVSEETKEDEIKLEEVIEPVMVDVIKDESIIEKKEKDDVIKEEQNEEITDNNEEQNKQVIDNKEEQQIEVHYLKNGFFEEDGNVYYYENDNKVTGLKNINGVNNYFSPSGKYLGISKVKVIDVSYYQKDINWDAFATESDCYGVILRLGYWNVLDKKFERNINELKRLNIPYGIYLFSYATSTYGAKKEATFTNEMIDKYDIKPTLGIYYDLESWKTNNSSSDKITKNGYNYIAKAYVESVLNHVNNNYNVGVYSGRWYAMNRLGSVAKSYVSWVAEYNSTLKYDDSYSMWQYTSKGKVPGIEGNVDISYLY